MVLCMMALCMCIYTFICFVIVLAYIATEVIRSRRVYGFLRRTRATDNETTLSGLVCERLK